MDKNYESVGKYISMLNRRGACFLSRNFAPYGIGSGQITFLASLYTCDGLSQEDLSCKLRVDKATTARAIKKLEEEGYVIRKVNEKDKRAYNIFITEKALAIKEDFYKILKRWSHILSEGFTIEEKDLVINLMKRMLEKADEATKKGEILCNKTDKRF